MTTINLLPWRQTQREERKKEFLIYLGIAALISALLMLPVYLYLVHRISEQNERNAYITSEITLLEKQIKEIQNLKREKTQLLARMNIIQQLQSDRNMVVHIFDEIVRIMPDGVYLTALKREGAAIHFIGISDSNGAISRLMRSIEKSEWLTQPELKQINTNQKEGVRANNFQLILQEKKSEVHKIKEDIF